MLEFFFGGGAGEVESITGEGCRILYSQVFIFCVQYNFGIKWVGLEFYLWVQLGRFRKVFYGGFERAMLIVGEVLVEMVFRFSEEFVGRYVRVSFCFFRIFQFCFRLVSLEFEFVLEADFKKFFFFFSVLEVDKEFQRLLVFDI